MLLEQYCCSRSFNLTYVNDNLCVDGGFSTTAINYRYNTTIAANLMAFKTQKMMINNIVDIVDRSAKLCSTHSKL